MKPWRFQRTAFAHRPHDVRICRLGVECAALSPFKSLSAIALEPIDLLDRFLYFLKSRIVEIVGHSDYPARRCFNQPRSQSCLEVPVSKVLSGSSVKNKRTGSSSNNVPEPPGSCDDSKALTWHCPAFLLWLLSPRSGKSASWLFCPP